jgi:stage V sporulation protein G
VEVTEAKVKLVSDKADKLKAFCTITIDDEFVIRDIKVIKGTRGYFVAMPSRKLMDRCPSCGGKNHLRSAYCNDCGRELRDNRVSHDTEGRAKLHADIAHPINSGCRDRLQRRIIAAYEEEVEMSKQPGYMPAAYEDDSYEPYEQPAAPASTRAGEPSAATLDAGPATSVAQRDDAPPPPPSDSPSPGRDTFGSGIL